MRVFARQGRHVLMALTIAATVLLSAACGSTQPGFVPTGSAMPAMPSMAESAGPAAAPAAAAGATAVAIQNFAFSPATLSVKVGSTVTWTNKDGEAHNVTTPSGPLHSPTMPPGAVYSYTFTAAGTFHYLCTIHPFMTATVTVTP
jgi:plastocyanin